MELQSFNYHTHTYLCGHAIGSAEEMILAAIEAKFKVIGISEHMGYEGWDDPKDRIAYKELDAYIEMMQDLKIKYKDQIDVRIGFECEFFEDSIEHLKEYQKKVDYLICGQHSPDRNGYEYLTPPYDGDDYIELMAEQICRGIELGLFKYIAHLDYFMLSNCSYTPRKREAILKVARYAKEHDVVLEINLKGPKYGKNKYEYGESYKYPNLETFRLIASVGTKVCFGYDAHSPQALKRRDIEIEIKNMFKHLNLNYVEDLYL